MYDDLPPETTGAGAQASSEGVGTTKTASSTLSSLSSSSSSDTTSFALSQPMAQKILRLQQAKAKLKKSTALLQIKSNISENTKPKDEHPQSLPSQQQQQQHKAYKVAASSNLLLSDLGYGAEEMVIDPYDPATPNDYSEYARNRSEVRRREKLMRRAAKREKKSEIVLNLHITAEEAYLHRARMSGKIVTELPPPQSLPSQEKQFSTDVTTTATAQSETDLKLLIDSELDGVPWFPDNDIIETLRMQRVMRHKMEKRRRKMREMEQKRKDGIGAKIMEKMGWRDGMGLGRQEQGITAPLVALRDRDNAKCGEIVAGENAESGKRVVLCLTNMIGPSEVDDEFDREVMDECGRYGNVLSVATKVWNGEVKVFVKFEDENAAALGLDSLDGRIFGGRKVRAKYYSASSFDSGDYSL